jgi:hypothetical protein
MVKLGSLEETLDVEVIVIRGWDWMCDDLGWVCGR